MSFEDLVPYTDHSPPKPKKRRIAENKDDSEDDIDLSRGEERDSNVIEEKGITFS